MVELSGQRGQASGGALRRHAEAGRDRPGDRPQAALHSLRRANDRAGPRHRRADGPADRSELATWGLPGWWSPTTCAALSAWATVWPCCTRVPSARSAPRDEMQASHDPVVRQFIEGRPDPVVLEPVARRSVRVKRSNEFAVGLAVLAALALVIGGALWLSETDVNQKQASYKARFRTVGGLGRGRTGHPAGCQGWPGRDHPAGGERMGGDRLQHRPIG